ncbi:TolC family protein [bacterium]|nr:TolC family protein [bacterium]
MRIQAWSLVLISIFSFGRGSAGDLFTAPPPDGRLSLDEAMRLALAHNEAIRRAQLAQEAAELQLGVVRADFSPLVNVSASAREAGTRSRDVFSIAGQTFGSGRIVEDTEYDQQLAPVLSKRWTSGLSTSLSGSVGYNSDSDVPSVVEWRADYPLSGKERARIRERVDNARLLAEQQANAAVVSQEDIRLAVISAYYAVIQASEQAGIVIDFLRQSRSILDYNESMLSGGFVASLQVDESRIEVQRRQADLLTTEDQVAARREALNVLVGLPVDASYVLVEDLRLTENTKSLEQWIAETLAANLNLSNLDKSLAMQLNSLEVTRRLDNADVQLGASARRTEDGDETLMLELTLFWPLYDGGVKRMLTESAYKDIQSNRLARWNLERQLVAAVRDDYRRLSSEWSRAAILQQSVALAERNIDIARENYEAGRLPYRNFVDIQLDLANARDSLIASQVSYKVALARLSSRVHPSPWQTER